MPFDPSQADAPGHRISEAETGGPLSRQLTHIGVLQLARLIKRGSDLLYSRISGLSDFDWRVLARVCDMPGLSISDLGVMLDRGPAQVSRTVKRLVGMGLLERRSLGGGPGVAIEPTPLGEQAYAPMVEVAIRSERSLTEGLTEEELKSLPRILAVLRRNALARLAREQRLQGEAEGREGD